MKSQSVTIRMKAIIEYFPVVLLVMLYKVVLTFDSVDEILKYVHVLCCSVINWAVKRGFYLLGLYMDDILTCDTIYLTYYSRPF